MNKRLKDGKNCPEIEEVGRKRVTNGWKSTVISFLRCVTYMEIKGIPKMSLKPGILKGTALRGKNHLSVWGMASIHGAWRSIKQHKELLTSVLMRISGPCQLTPSKMLHSPETENEQNAGLR